MMSSNSHDRPCLGTIPSIFTCESRYHQVKSCFQEISRKISISQHSRGTKETKFSLAALAIVTKPSGIGKVFWGRYSFYLLPLYLQVILLSTERNNRTEIRKVSVAVSKVLRERHCNAESTSINDWTRMKQSMWWNVQLQDTNAILHVGARWDTTCHTISQWNYK